MSEYKENQIPFSRVQLLAQYLQALEQEDVQTANQIFAMINSDAQLKNIISSINVAYEQEDSTSATLVNAELSTGKIRLVIVEDNYIIRVGIRETLSDNPDIEIIGEATSYLEGLRLIQQQQPDVAIIDVELPHQNGIELIRQLQQCNFAVKSVVLGKSESKETILAAFAAGAFSYCVKDVKLNHLLEAIYVTHNGKKWIDPAIAEIILAIAKVRTFSINKNFDAQDFNLLTGSGIKTFHFTRRELEVLHFLVNGYKNVEISNKLVIGVGTVKTHITNLYNKLGATDRTQAVINALRFGVVLMT